jgi:hypothetical protein
MDTLPEFELTKLSEKRRMSGKLVFETFSANGADYSLTGKVLLIGGNAVALCYWSIELSASSV